MFKSLIVLSAMLLSGPLPKPAACDCPSCPCCDGMKSGAASMMSCDCKPSCDCPDCACCNQTRHAQASAPGDQPVAMFQKIAVATVPQDAGNPVQPTPESLEHARKLYGYDCAMCHGATGDGKGESAINLKLTMKDFTDAGQMKTVSDTEIYNVIHNRKGQMPAEGDRASAEVTWNMVALVRSFAKK